MNPEKFLSIQSSETTRKQYESVLRLYESYCRESGSIWNSIDTVNMYTAYLRREKVALNTIKNRLACIRSYFEYCKISIEEFPNIKGDVYTPTNGLTDDEVQRILTCIPKTESMHTALIRLLLYTGIRRSEAAGIKFGDIQKHDSVYVLTVIGKGNKIRHVPLQNEVMEYIYSYAPEVYAKKDKPLFSIDGINPIHPNTIYNLVLKYSKLAGIDKKITPHSFRVTAVTNAISNGSNLIDVQAMGGWSNLDMVTRYDRSHKLLKNSAALKINYRK